jgi:hypothetical protein
LGEIQKAVEKHYAQKKWVTERVEQTRARTLKALQDLHSSDDVVTGVIPFFFAVMSMAQLPALADLGNPTMRKCLVVFRELVARQGQHPLHASLLRFLGSDAMSRQEVERHHHDLTATFDRALEIARSPSLGDFCSTAARPIAIDGAWELVEDGYHREAMLWIMCMRAVCQATIDKDAPDREKAQHTQRYKAFLAELGLGSAKDLQERAQYGERLLDEVMHVAEQIIDTNPDVSE